MNKKQNKLNPDILDSITEAIQDMQNNHLPKAKTYQELEKILNS